MKPSLHKVDDDDDDDDDDDGDDDDDDDYYYYHYYYYCYKSVRKLDPVLKQAGLRSLPISVQFSIKLFQTGNTCTSL